jgi:transketolase
VLTLEEHTVVGGLGSAVAEALLDEGFAPRAFKRLGVQDIYPSIVGDQRFLRRAYGIDSVALADAVRNALGRDG